MRGQARITDSNVADMLREVRMALLEPQLLELNQTPHPTLG